MNRKMKTIDLVYMAVGAVLISVCSWISIPTTVPFTLQTFAVYCVLGILGGKRGTISILVYILLGAVGVPVFSGFKGGFGVILGSTGGYIVGFILIGLLYWLAEPVIRRIVSSSDKKGTSSSGKGLRAAGIAVRYAALIIGTAVCYAFGTAWFIVVYTRNTGAVGIGTALAWCVIPFIIPDLIKMVLASLISSRIRKILK